MHVPEDKEAVLSLYREGPAILQRALDGLAGEDPDVVVTDGGWTIRQVVHHLADGDDIWKSAIKMQPEHVVHHVRQIVGRAGAEPVAD